MRIVHLTWAFDPFMGYQEIHLAREQMRRGHKVVILTSNILGGSGPIITGKGTGKEKTKACRQIEQGFDVYRLPGSFVLGRVWLGNIGKALDELKPDVIHCHAVMQYYSVCVALYKKKHKSVRVIYDSHNIQSVIRERFFDKIGRWFGRIIFKAISSKD